MEAPAPPVASEPPRKRWTWEEILVLDAAGVDLNHFELIEGELVDKMGNSPPHVTQALALRDWLIGVFGLEKVRQESPMKLARKERSTVPEPDLVVLRVSYKQFARKHPTADDVLLIVEVSNGTLGFNLNKKAALYAQAGIPDCWVLDVKGRRPFVHREPVDGKYRSILVDSENETVASLAAPESPFPLLPPLSRIKRL
jgi:Uma2 family endonuclease